MRSVGDLPETLPPLQLTTSIKGKMHKNTNLVDGRGILNQIY